MTLDDLQKRLIAIDTEKKQLMANYNALLGAEQECHHWIKTVCEATQPVSSEATKNVESTEDDAA